MINRQQFSVLLLFNVIRAADWTILKAKGNEYCVITMAPETFDFAREILAFNENDIFNEYI